MKESGVDLVDYRKVIGSLEESGGESLKTIIAEDLAAGVVDSKVLIALQILVEFRKGKRKVLLEVLDTGTLSHDEAAVWIEEALGFAVKKSWFWFLRSRVIILS